MANGYSPYQVAAPTVNLMGQSGVTKKKKETGDLETALQMGRMEEAFRQETEGLGEAASSAERGSKGTRHGEKALQLFSLFTNPLLAGLLGGFLGGKKHRRARKARKKLLNLQDKWGKTFLRGGARDYLSEAESLQLDSGGDFMAALKTGVSSGMMSKLLGGKVKGGEGGSPADKLFGRDVGTPMTKTQPLLDDAGVQIGTELMDYTKPKFFEGSELFKGDFDIKKMMMLPALLQSLLGEQDY